MGRRHRLVAVPLAAALVVTVAAVARAQPGGPAAGRTTDGAFAAVDDPGHAGLTTCNGGAQEFSLAQMDDVPATIGENAAFAGLPGAAVTFQVPGGDTDQVVAVFTAQAGLFGQPLTYVTPVDALQVQIRLDGLPMVTQTDLVFTSDPAQSNATQSCRRVGPGMHTVDVQWRLLDQAANDVLTGELRNWTLHVEISN
jgi:hypothetical protein